MGSTPPASRVPVAADDPRKQDAQERAFEATLYLLDKGEW